MDWYVYGPTKTYAVCQFADLTLRDYLPCPHKESGGYQCERQDAHGEDGHWWSDHTPIHQRFGNGYACSAFEEPVAAGAYRARLVEKIERLTKELGELDTHSKLM